MALSSSSAKMNIFFSLSTTDEDRALFAKLQAQLSLLRWQGMIESWYDTLITPGDPTDNAIQAYIQAADIIVLLMSADFTASQQCMQVELASALEQETRQKARVIPVLLRPVDLRGLPLAQYHPLPTNGKPISIWENLDLALLDVAQGIRRIVEDSIHHFAGRPQLTRGMQPPLSTSPLRRNPFFTNRETTLAELYSFFTHAQNAQEGTQILYGLRGIGKTLLAVEYAYSSPARYQKVLWLNAASTEQWNSDLRTACDQLAITLRREAREAEYRAALTQWLCSHEHWLLVIDNLEDPSLLHQFIPATTNGHVLVTTHTQTTGPFGRAVAVDELTVDEGALLLLRRAKRIAPHDTLAAASPAEREQAQAISQEMQGYPLALDQAGAYIEETRWSLANYLHHYQQRQAEFLAKRGRLVQGHADPVTTTLTMTFARLASSHPRALELLQFLAFLHPDGLPDEILVHGAEALMPGSLRTLALDPVALAEAIVKLRDFSLIHHQTDSTRLNMHRIIQIVLKQELKRSQQVQLAKQAVYLINAIFPEVRFSTWDECERYRDQAQQCAELLHEFQLLLPEGALLLERLGFYYYQRGNYSQSETILTQALELQKKLRRIDPLDKAQTLNSLGLLYQRQARYQQALEQHQQALKLRKQTLGEEDTATAESLYNLAVLYEISAHYQQAEHYYLRVLAIDERLSGPNHPETAGTLNNLALIYYLQKRYQQAETTYRRALAIYEAAGYNNHPDITYTITGLASLYEIQGQYQQAAEYYQRAFTIRKQALGEKHGETAHSINKLGRIAELQGDDQQAQAHYQQALEISEQLWQTAHPDTALFLNNLALLLARQGHTQQAEPLYRRALAIYELTLGDQHPTVAHVLTNLAQLLHASGNEEAAAELQQRAQAIQQKLSE